MSRNRIPVGVTPEEKAEIQHRAAAHGLSVAAFMRKAALGTFGAPEDDPDVWWDTKTHKRKRQIMRWESGGKCAERPAGDLLPFDE